MPIFKKRNSHQPNVSLLTSIIVTKESERRRGPIEAASAVKVNLDAKSSFDSVSTCMIFGEHNVGKNIKNLLSVV